MAVVLVNDDAGAPHRWLPGIQPPGSLDRLLPFEGSDLDRLDQLSMVLFVRLLQEHFVLSDLEVLEECDSEPFQRTVAIQHFIQFAEDLLVILGNGLHFRHVGERFPLARGSMSRDH